MSATRPKPAQTLASRFESSFAAFQTREGCNNPTQPLELAIANIAGTACAARRFGPEVNELLQLAARQMTTQTIDGMIRSIIEGIGGVLRISAGGISLPGDRYRCTIAGLCRALRLLRLAGIRRS